jgi:LysR family transcriptional activator of nhaA
MRVAGEFDDLALMKVMASKFSAVVPVPSVVSREAAERYELKSIGVADRCVVEIYAITAERKITHPIVGMLTGHARRLVFG